MEQIITEYWRKPGPTDRFDWEAVTINYDLGSPIGYGRTETEVINDLIIQIRE